MKPNIKHILIALGIGAGAFVLYEMYKAYQAGKTAISDLLAAPWNAVKAAWSGVSSAASSAAATVANNYNWATQLPSLTQQELTDAQQQGSVAASYQPGGTIYNSILATQGQAAADAAAQTAAQNAATQQQQANADASWWGTDLFRWV
ncbi:MAG: hypothetical protein ACRED1_06350 [Limisphaerales bacterium]